MRVICRQYPAEWEHLTVYPIADVHWGAKECMESAFKAYIERIRQDERAVVVLCGDLINCGIKSSVTNVYDEKYSPGNRSGIWWSYCGL